MNSTAPTPSRPTPSRPTQSGPTPSRPARLRPDRTWAVLAARVALVVVAGTLFAVAAPVSAVVYDVPVPLALLVTGVLAVSLAASPWAPRTASTVHLVALAALGLLSAPGTASPWPVPVTGMIGLGALVVVLGVRTSWRLTAVVWAVGAALPLVLVAVVPGRWDQVDVWAASFVVSAGDSLILAAAAVVIGQRRSIRAELDAARRDAELEAARRRTVEERSRIARELHDVVAHSMSVVHMQAESAPYRLPDLAPDARAEFAVIADTSRSALREMRQLLGTLRGGDDAERAPQPTLADLGALVSATRAAGLDVDLDAPEAQATDDDDVDRLTQLTAYRIVQESLGNVARHAPGAAARVTVGRPGARLLVEVTNAAPPSGIPAAPPDDGGFGLAGMRERVAAVGGTLEHGPTPDGGFRVVAVLPTRPTATDGRTR